jgi:hypothetical protein
MGEKIVSDRAIDDQETTSIADGGEGIGPAENIGQRAVDAGMNPKKPDVPTVGSGKRAEKIKSGIFIAWIIYFGASILCFILLNIVGNLFYEPLMEQGEEALFHFIMLSLLLFFLLANFFWFKYCIKRYEKKQKPGTAPASPENRIPSRIGSR